jgi:hypothetical protein
VKLNILVALLLMMAMHAPLSHAVKLYKWVDEQGNVTYQDRPPPANASAVEEKDIDPNEGVTKFVLPKPTEASSDDERSPGSGPSSGSGGLSPAEKGAIATTDRPFRSERRRGVVPTPPPRPAPAVPPRRPRRAGIPRGGRIPRIPHR